MSGINSKKLAEWFFPFLVMFMFVTMLAAILADIPSLSPGILLAYSASPLAYSLMLVGTFIASRPRFLEKHVGMPRMYEIHAVYTIIAGGLVLIHIIFMWRGIENVFRSPATFFGYLGAAGILFGALSGIFSLSGMFVNNYKRARNIKENVLNRELMLWVHRISALTAIIGTYLQAVLIPFLRNNTPYMVLLTTYTVATLAYYAYWKYKIVASPEHKVKKIYRATPTLWVLEFEPLKGQIKNYTAGDYFFIRFKGDADITKEPHPFSTSSAVTKQFSNTIEFMIKEAGDWTKALANVKEGDIATLEGPYGDFFPKYVQETKEEDVPFVLLGGGIGLTPNLSVLRHEIEKGSQREIHLVWGLSYEEDMFMVDELEAMKEINPNFHYHIIFSNEEVEGYDFGFITNQYLEQVGAAHYQKGHFFICGPAPMLNAVRVVLANGNVPADQIHLDDFGF